MFISVTFIEGGLYLATVFVSPYSCVLIEKARSLNGIILGEAIFHTYT
jgi:hypothetical protein